MATYGHITPRLFDFLRELKENNNRDWFQANKNRYESDVREPLLDFVREFRLKLPSISPHFVADDRKTGGSLFRIYRDVRFSKDKSPYKTHAALQFRHKNASKNVHAPGFYIGFSPGDVHAGMGVWHPERDALRAIRVAIDAEPETWKTIIGNDAFAAQFTPGGESLKKAPKGFDPDHPLIDELKRKDFFVMCEFTQKEACRPDFIDTYVEACISGSAYVKFLADALELPF